LLSDGKLRKQISVVYFWILFLKFGVPYWIYLAAGCWLRLSEAKLAEEGEFAPLLTTKYEPDVVKTDRDIEVGKWRFFDSVRSAMLVTSLWAVRVSYPLSIPKSLNV